MTNELEPDMDNYNPFEDEDEDSPPEWEIIDSESSYPEKEDDNLPWDPDD